MEHMRVWLSAVVLHIFQTCGVFLSLTSNPTVCQYVFVWTGEYQHREKRSVCDGTCGSSLIFSIDFLLFSLLHSQGNRCLTWKCPAKESRGFTETNRGWGKNDERREEKKKEEESGGACNHADHWGPCWPLTLIMTWEVTAEVRGCVKVPLRRFTPLLGGDDLMQPPQPVWHDQCCSLPAAPMGLTSVSNPATQGPLKAPYRQSQWAGEKGTQTEKSGRVKRTERLFYFMPCSSGWAAHLVL